MARSKSTEESERVHSVQPWCAGIKLKADGTVESIQVTHAGDDSIAPAEVTFSSGGAKAAVIVQNGKVVAFKILDEGPGYTQAPGVRVTGGLGQFRK